MPDESLPLSPELEATVNSRAAEEQGEQQELWAWMMLILNLFLNSRARTNDSHDQFDTLPEKTLFNSGGSNVVHMHQVVMNT